MKKAISLIKLNRHLKSRIHSHSLYSQPISYFPSPNPQTGFTIVELLVVIVVIGILAAITIVSYTGITAKANDVSLKSDLTNASKQLKLYYVDHGAYPTSFDGSNCPLDSSSTVDTRYCVKTSNGSAFVYTNLSPSTFGLRATNNTNTKAFSITDSTQPITTAACPTGFIPVPGSPTYSTSDFCVMKYEAKNVGGVATSQPALTPWVSISQSSAVTTAAASCTGCHLISEPEWMTIAQNVLSVPSNWISGTVGTGSVYIGQSDGNPNNAQAVTNVNDGYSNTGNVSPSNQRRTLILTNGEVIWDMSGNVWEWTSGTITTGQPGVTGGAYTFREWTAITNPGTAVPDPSPASTGIPGASGWNSSNGIGKLYSYADETVLHVFRRGGNWGDGNTNGILGLILSSTPDSTQSYITFRAAK